MKYEVIMEKNGYALIKRGIDLEEYAVVSRLNRETESWAYTCVYYNFSPFSNLTQAEALALSTDYFCYKTQNNYIPRYRLEELATKFKDRISEDALEFALTDDDYKEFFLDECEMKPHELEFFGIEMESEENGYGI